MDIFIERLQKIINKKDITQRELAKLTGVTEVTISRYLSGERKPRIEIISKIAEVLNVSIDYLLGNSDNPTPIDQKEPSIDEEITQIMKDLGPDVTLQFYDLKGMSDEEKEDLKLFLQLLKAKREKKDENN